jgi:hypothetical protein
MRRALVLSAVFVLTLAGLGCQGITTGRCDCNNHPEDAQIPPPHNPYATIGSPNPGAPVTPVTPER